MRDLSRTAVDRWLKVARLPFDAATHLLPSERGPHNVATLAIDRADATVRAAVGQVLHDDELREDAHRRRAAADQRAQAVKLRRVADAKRQQSEEALTDELDNAAELREQAKRDERERIQKADAERARRQERARETAQARQRSVEEAARERREAEEQDAKRQRLEVLDEQARALDRDDEALTAVDEAQRLRDAASAVKATRKAKR